MTRVFLQDIIEYPRFEDLPTIPPLIKGKGSP